MIFCKAHFPGFCLRNSKYMSTSKLEGEEFLFPSAFKGPAWPDKTDFQTFKHSYRVCLSSEESCPSFVGVAAILMLHVSAGAGLTLIFLHASPADNVQS